MNSLKFSAALAAVTGPLMLAACGGGGGGGGPSTGLGPVTGPENLAQVRSFDPQATQGAVGSAARQDPQYGSVFQASNDRATTVTRSGNRFDLRVAGALGLNSDDHSLGSTGVESPVAGHSGYTEEWVDTTPSSLSGAAVFVSWNETDSADWLAAGYWLHATGDVTTGTIDSIEAGSFADGPAFEDRTSAMPSDGTATYTGIVGGIYAYDNPLEPRNIEIGDVEGTVSLTANFVTSSISGSVSGLAEGVEVTLEPTDYTETGRIGSGSVSLTIDGNQIDGVDGKWGGRFSTTEDSGGAPLLVVGTAGAEWERPGTGGMGTFIGAFVASK